jgi:hypothetical protein
MGRESYYELRYKSVQELVVRHDSLHRWILETKEDKNFITTFNCVGADDVRDVCINFMTSFNMGYNLEIEDAIESKYYSAKARCNDLGDGE